MTSCRADLYPGLKLEDISKRFDNAGPTARFCLEKEPGVMIEFYADRDAAIDLGTPQHLVTALINDKQRLRIRCVVRRSDSKTSSFTVEPISPFVRQRLPTQIWKWKTEDRLAMIQQFSRVPGTGGMTGLLFESHHHHRFIEKIDIVAAPMFRTRNLRSRWHAAFGDFSASPTLRKAQEEAMNTLPPPTPIHLSISPSKSLIYEHSGQLSIEENVYYVPAVENEVAIDSFIVHAGHLYLFQFASGPEHGVNRGLMTTLARFSGLPSIENLHFIFVVPKYLTPSHLSSLYRWSFTRSCSICSTG